MKKTKLMIDLEICYNKPIEQILLETLKETGSYKKAGKKLKISDRTVSNYIETLGLGDKAIKYLTSRKRPFTEKEIQKIKEAKENESVYLKMEKYEDIFNKIKIGDVIKIYINPKRESGSKQYTDYKVIFKTAHILTVQQLGKPWNKTTVTVKDLICGDIQIKKTHYKSEEQNANKQRRY